MNNTNTYKTVWGENSIVIIEEKKTYGTYEYVNGEWVLL